MRVLVTGAGGYIGRNVLGPLARLGFEVHGVGRSQTAGSEALWHRADLLDAGERQALLAAVQPSHLLHLAWCTEHGRYWTDPRNALWSAATIEMVQEFRAEGGHRAVVAGTCAEYDWTTGHADLHETRSPRRPSTPYGQAKLATQERLTSYADRLGISHGWAVIFFSFGPFEDSRRMVPSVITSLLADKPVTIHHGALVRDMLDVRELGAGVAALLASETQGRVNVASGRGVALADVAQRLARLIGRSELLEVGDTAGPSHPHRLVADIDRLRREVGFVPRQQLDDALASTVSWWRSAMASHTNTGSR